MLGKLVTAVAVSCAIAIGALGLAPSAGATTRTLTLSQGAAFAILGHSCGGIQEKVYATGFAANGYPTGAAELSTSCGGSGRGGGYKTTKYTGWASVEWDWFGDTRAYAKLTGPPEGISTSFSAEDPYGDRLYNVGTTVYLETASPPLKPPAAPGNVTVTSAPIEVGESIVLRFQVTWTPAPETARLITSSTVTAVAVGSSAPTVTTTVSGYGSGAILSPLEPNTTYRITVTNTDAEGTSEPSAAVEATSPNSEGEAGGLPPENGPEFGRCVKVGVHGEYTTANCETESPTETGAYNWVRGVQARAFAVALKAATVKLEVTGGEKVTCTAAASSGQVTDVKTAGEVVITLTGCESLAGSCTSEGLAAGELQTTPLSGALGVVSTTEKEGKEIRHIGLSLHPATGTTVLEFTCSVSGIWRIEGGVIANVSSGKMSKAMTLKWSASTGRQKPEGFEGAVKEVLLNQLSEQAGLTLTTAPVYGEATEINPVV